MNPIQLCDALLIKFTAKYPLALAKVLPADKCLHALVGFPIGAGAALILPQWPSAAFAGLIAGALKETIDSIRGKSFDKMDMLATLIGASLATPICLIRMH